MNRRNVITGSLLVFLGLPQKVYAQPAVAEIVYGPVLADCPQGHLYWMVATKDGAHPIPDYAEIFRLPQDQFVTAIRNAGEWTLQGGWPHKWNRRSQRWDQLL